MMDKFYLQFFAEPGPVVTTTLDRDRRAIDCSKVITQLIPEADPYAVILMKARKEATDTAEYIWFDDEPVGWWTQINDSTLNDAAANTATLKVKDASLFAVNDILKVPRTGEVLRVTEATATDVSQQVKVVRGYGTTAAAKLLNEDWLMRIGNAMEENSNAPASKLNQPTKYTNYTQIVRTTFDESMTSAHEVKRVGGKERTRLRAKKLMEHRLDIARISLWGEKQEDLSGGKPRRMTAGINSFITKRKDIGGGMTEAEWEAFLEEGFEYGSKTKLFVCSRTVGGAVNMIAQNKIVTSSGEDIYGIRLPKYRSFHGDVLIAVDRSLENAYAGYGFLLDMNNIVYRPLNGRDTKLHPNIQANDVDGWVDEYLTEFGMMVRQPKTHAVLFGCTGYQP
jgi:hypothetical protein